MGDNLTSRALRVSQSLLVELPVRPSVILVTWPKFHAVRAQISCAGLPWLGCLIFCHVTFCRWEAAGMASGGYAQGRSRETGCVKELFLLKSHQEAQRFFHHLENLVYSPTHPCSFYCSMMIRETLYVQCNKEHPWLHGFLPLQILGRLPTAFEQV